MRHHLLLTSYFLLLTSAHALTDAWSVDARQHTAVQRTYKQGEAWTMQVTLRDGLKAMPLTNATARFYWYTNATDNVWWTNAASITAPLSGTITAEWTPAMDTGAAYNYFWVGIWTSGATSPLWRVTGTIRMLPSPGFTPNALPMPVRTLDFSSVSLTNAPWATTNALASALQSASETNSLFAAWFGSLFNSTSRWDAAYGWGDWHSAVAQKLDITSTNGWETGSHAAFLTGEADLAALRLYHYGSPHIIESPTNWFLHDGAGMITGVNTASVTNWNIVIPWEIGGVQVTILGALSFSKNYEGTHVETLTAPRKLTVVGTQAFLNCDFLKSIIFRGELLNVNSQAFQNCLNLKSVSFPGNAPSIEYDIYDGLFSDQVTNYVTSAAATGWGSTFGGMPVVRLPLHTDALTLGGVTRTNWPSADLSGLATTQALAAVVSDKELHADSFTNLIWRSVFSNGWHWLVAYTNTP